MTELPAGTAIDRYTVVDVLGAGAMGVVYRVRHTQLGSEHALKVVGVDNRQLVARLLREGRLQAGLKHPHIVAVTDVVEVGGRPGLVMELVEGTDLEAWLAEHPEAPLDTRLALFRQILDAVAYAHAQHTIHRDLKPANILVTELGGIPHAKVADFGLAKWLADDGDGAVGYETRAGIAMGTPRYMAPEQFVDARSVDARADVFALGCILAEVVTGETAYGGDSIQAIHHAVLQGPPALPADFPADLAAVVQRATATERDDRFASCEDLAAALDAPPVEATQGRAWVALAAGAGGGLTLGLGVALLVGILALGCAAWFLDGASVEPPASEPPSDDGPGFEAPRRERPERPEPEPPVRRVPREKSPPADDGGKGRGDDDKDRDDKKGRDDDKKDKDKGKGGKGKGGKSKK